MNIAKFIAAIAFYTSIPVPSSLALDFQGIARFAPLVGVFLGGVLGLVDEGLHLAGLPVLTRSVVIIVVWIGITGGLHLDGAMDTADGLAVTDPQRRLEVMADSVTGAFGVMAAISIVLLKAAALADLDHLRWLTLIIALGWGRWAQQVAIVRYPYLKPTGKGAFHKEAMRSIWDVVPALLLLLGLSALPLYWNALANTPLLPSASILLPWSGGFLALLIPAYFNRKLGGHTGDTYGAVVEWTEALFLGLMTLT